MNYINIFLRMQQPVLAIFQLQVSVLRSFEPNNLSRLSLESCIHYLSIIRYFLTANCLPSFLEILLFWCTHRKVHTSRLGGIHFGCMNRFLLIFLLTIQRNFSIQQNYVHAPNTKQIISGWCFLIDYVNFHYMK
jgi:hypothetical protein